MTLLCGVVELIYSNTVWRYVVIYSKFEYVTYNLK